VAGIGLKPAEFDLNGEAEGVFFKSKLKPFFIGVGNSSF